MIKASHIDENENFHELVLNKRSDGNQRILLYLETDLDEPFYYLKKRKEEKKLNVFMFPHHMDACALNRR